MTLTLKRKNEWAYTLEFYGRSLTIYILDPGYVVWGSGTPRNTVVVGRFETLGEARAAAEEYLSDG